MTAAARCAAFAVTGYAHAEHAFGYRWAAQMAFVPSSNTFLDANVKRCLHPSDLPSRLYNVAGSSPTSTGTHCAQHAVQVVEQRSQRNLHCSLVGVGAACQSPRRRRHVQLAAHVRAIREWNQECRRPCPFAHGD
jgi:hypothetical protein